MKKFCITISERGEAFTPRFSEVIEGDELLEVLSQLILTIGRLHRQLLHEQFVKNVQQEDDIPF